MTVGDESRFYRVLSDLLARPTSFDRWQAGNYSCIHDGVIPESWITLYFGEGKRNSDNYELGGLHEDALKYFLNAAINYSSREMWESAAPLIAVPVAGVSAFPDQQSAVDYTGGQIANWWIVRFNGRVIRGLDAEEDGYLVEPLEHAEPIALADYMKRKRLGFSRS